MYSLEKKFSSEGMNGYPTGLMTIDFNFIKAPITHISPNTNLDVSTQMIKWDSKQKEVIIGLDFCKSCVRAF